MLIEKWCFIMLLCLIKLLREFGFFGLEITARIDQYWSLIYKITLKANVSTLEHEITFTVKQYAAETNRMFNLTRMVFYLEHGLNMPFCDFIKLLAKLDRITLIRYALLYIIDDIASLTSEIIKDSFDHYYEFGSFYVDHDRMPDVPALPFCNMEFSYAA